MTSDFMSREALGGEPGDFKDCFVSVPKSEACFFLKCGSERSGFTVHFHPLGHRHAPGRLPTEVLAFTPLLKRRAVSYFPDSGLLHLSLPAPLE
jgi:hypothetical protein